MVSFFLQPLFELIQDKRVKAIGSTLVRVSICSVMASYYSLTFVQHVILVFFVVLVGRIPKNGNFLLSFRTR